MTPDEIMRKSQTLAESGRAAEGLELLQHLHDEAAQYARVRLVARTSREIGSMLLGLGRASDAIRQLDSDREWLVDHVAAATLVGLQDVARATAMRAAQRSSDALTTLTGARVALQERAPEITLATLAHDRAVLLAELGRAEEAIAEFVRAREIFLGERDRLGVAASDHNLGYVLHDLGNFDDSIEYLQEARNVFLALGRAEEAAACDQNLGVVFFDLGRFEEAGRRFAVAHHRFEEADAKRSAGECDYNLGAVLDTLHHDDEAIRYRARAAKAGVEAPLDIGLSGQIPAVSIDPMASQDEPSEGIAEPDTQGQGDAGGGGMTGNASK